MPTRSQVADGSSRGFSLLEVLVSMAITVIVLAAVFSLLTRAQGSFEREPRVADLNQSARVMLETISTDIMRAGAGLPPEFPSFTPKSVDPTVGNGANGIADVIEIIGASDNAMRESVLRFDGDVAVMSLVHTNFDIGDLVVVYNDDPKISLWRMGWVTAIDDVGGSPRLTVNNRRDGKTISPAYSHDLDVSGQPGYPWHHAFMIEVSVVRYRPNHQGSDLVLVRQLDFETFTPLGTIDDFQISYQVGNAGSEERGDPPHPHPIDGFSLAAADVITAVRVSLTAFSSQGREPLRKGFSTSAYPRAIVSGLAKRTRENR